MSRTKHAGSKTKRGDRDDASDRCVKKLKAPDVSLADVNLATTALTATSTAVDVISALLGGMAFDRFKGEYFEQQPLLVRSAGNQRLFEKDLFSRNTLLQLLGRHALEYGRDATVCRYVNGERDNYAPPNGKLEAKKKAVSGLLDKGYSCQFYQPQRYVDRLFALNSAFEEVFGGLAGASAYLTPPAAQALAPHHDDVEVFILQTEGRKTWKLYHPLVELAGEHSADLSMDQIGDVWKEFVLEEGDVLYFPRGTIHQACTDDKQFSTHVTVSVYQHNSWANFLEVALPRVIRRAFDSDVTFRRGLPIGYLNYMGSQFPSSSPEARSFRAACTTLIEKLGRWVDDDDLHEAADIASLDFIANRLPPSEPSSLLTAEFVLESAAMVQLVDRSHVRLVIGEDDLKDPVVSVYHSIRNCRIHHMGVCSCAIEAKSEHDSEGEGVFGGGRGEGGSSDEISDDGSDDDTDDMPMSQPPQAIVFPGHFALPLMKLFNAYPNKVKVADIVAVADDETEARGMLLRLWSEGLLHASTSPTT